MKAVPSIIHRPLLPMEEVVVVVVALVDSGDQEPLVELFLIALQQPEDKQQLFASLYAIHS